jgi:hypothetical protein
LLLTSCAKYPESYPPPEQRKFAAASDANVLGSIVRMGDLNAEAYFVKDIAMGLEGGAWRWTTEEPTLKFYLETNQNLRFVMDFAIADLTFKDTGPVTFSIFINGRLFDKARYDRPGEKHYEKPVPPGFFKPKSEVTVSVKPDKIWIAKDDGAKMGFILIRIGFEE